MSRINSRDTSPDLKVRSILHSSGYRFRLHRKDLPGKPDIVLPKYRTVIFVHGCFWHRHLDCKYAYTPKSNIEFWEKKFTANLERDWRNTEFLEQDGWTVKVVWECQTKNEVKLADLVRDIFEKKF